MYQKDSCGPNTLLKIFSCLHVKGIYNRKNLDEPICFPQSVTSAWLLKGQGLTGLKILQSTHDPNWVEHFPETYNRKTICSFGRLTALFMQCFREKGVCFLFCITVNYTK